MDGLCLKWNHHQLAFTNTLKYAYEKDLFCDASIVCQGKLFPVHKIVLATSSEYFSEILSQIDNEHPYIIVSDVNPAEIEALLNYMYRGEVNILEDNLASLIGAAEMLQIKGLAVSDDISSYVSNEQASVDELDNSDKTQLGPVGTETNDVPQTDETQQLKMPMDIKQENESLDCDPVSNSIASPCKDLTPKTNDNQNSAHETSNNCFSPTVLCKEEPIEMDLPADIRSDSKSLNENKFMHNVNQELNVFNGSTTETPISTFPNISDDPEMKYLSFPSNSATEVFSSNDPNLEPTDSISTTFDFMDFSPSSINSSKSCSPPKYSRSSKSPRYCLLCSFVYVTKEELKKHYAACHKGRKPFVCNFCNYQSFCTGTLNRHIKRHTGEKPYQCSSCSYKCAIKHNLTSHVIRAHPRGKTLE